MTLEQMNNFIKNYCCEDTVWFLFIFVIAITAAYFVGAILKILLNRTANQVQKAKRKLFAITLRSIGGGITFLCIALALNIGAGFVTLTPQLEKVISLALEILVWIALGAIAYRLVDVVCEWFKAFGAKRHSKMDEMLVPVVRATLRALVIGLLIVQIIQIMSQESVSSILAGLGIGSLAVALAAKDTISNFFGSIVIFTDRPFELGDRIVVDSHDGILEQVGVRSTRIRTMDGQLVTIPNGELANKTIRNISNRLYRRRLFHVGIAYDTPPEKVKRAPGIILDILKDHEGMSPDFPPRAFFVDFADYSLSIRVIYWYHPESFWDYLAFGEKFNLELLKRFNEEEIEFAFPTQTLYLAKDPARELAVDVSRS